MKKTTNKGNRYLTWVLRILLILMILFWALFSLDVFEYHQGFWNILVAVLMHNIPVFGMLFMLFSFDVFSEGQTFWKAILAFLMHNVFTFALLIVLFIAWKWEHIGGMLLMLCILGFTTFLIARSGRFMYGTLILVGIPFLIGAMFVVNHYLLGNKKSVNNTPPS